MIVAIIINAISPSVYDFGAHGDGRHTLAAVRRSSGTVESRGPVFAPTDVGKALICVGCRTRGNLIGRIVSVSRDRKTIRIEPRADRDAAQATLYWGTPDDTAFERMSKAGKRMRIPAARNSFFLLLKTWRLERLPGLIIAGDGERSLLLGDPGDHELVLLSGSPNAAISGIHIANVHGAPDLYWFGLHLEEERHASITNSFFTGSRCAIQMDGGGEDIAITSSHFDAAITSAINANGDASAPIRGIRVENSFVRNTIWMDGAGGTGHDINLEDVS
ncbi:MAG: hypothetical protein JO061_11420, partial [Acidobacteriaceae bacterium]|nr:hypothetical protein [Acidobacteriaceae bacterium]